MTILMHRELGKVLRYLITGIIHKNHSNKELFPRHNRKIDRKVGELKISQWNHQVAITKWLKKPNQGVREESFALEEQIGFLEEVLEATVDRGATEKLYQETEARASFGKTRRVKLEWNRGRQPEDFLPKES